MQETDLISFSDAAERLDISKNTIVWLVQREGLEVFRLAPTGIQRRRYLRVADVERLAAGEGWRRYAPRRTMNAASKKEG